MSAVFALSYSIYCNKHIFDNHKIFLLFLRRYAMIQDNKMQKNAEGMEVGKAFGEAK